MARSFDSCALPLSTKLKLRDCGFDSTEDVKESSCSELATELGITSADALKILEIARTQDSHPVSPRHDAVRHVVLRGASGSLPSSSAAVTSETGVSAVDMLEREKGKKYIITLCERIDQMLGGGITIGEVSEICGVPGIGKTQIGIQLACDAQIPACLNGPEGKVVYIDTEGSFMPSRAAQIAHALVQVVNPQVQSHAERKGEPLPKPLTAEEILHNIFVFRINDFVEQLSCIEMLPSFLEQHHEVCLVIIDSVSFQFRHFEANFNERTRLLMRMSGQLNTLAHEKEVAVVVMNQVTTKFSREDSVLIPALGETWAHACTTRIMLEWHGTMRVARLLKSPSQPRNLAPYKIGSDGVRGFRPKARSKRRHNSFSGLN
uniref:DNA repair protein RAD51 homolog 3 n=1 Tax=Hirondellea gigas TaxID=1518452 RepID=A0A6A7G8M4_9CRUS